MSNQQEMISFTKADLAKFKAAYNIAVKDDKHVFLFKNYEYVVDYAKYLIEYLDSKFKQ